MEWFRFSSKKEAATPCCCGSAPGAEQPVCDCGAEKTEVRSVKVLGSGCKSCHALYEAAKAAVQALGLSAEVEYVTDMEQIMQYGVMRMPALVVNEKVAAAGRVLGADEVETLLRSWDK